MPVPVGFASVRIPFRYLGADPYGVITFGVTDPLDATTPEEIADKVREEWVDSMIGLVDASIITGPIEVSLGTSSGDLPGVADGTDTGSRGMDSMPPNVACVVDKLTGTGGRRGRGRMFVPWVLADADVDERGVIGVPTVTSLQTGFNAFLVGLNTQGATMVLFHGDDSAPTTVTSLKVQNRVGTMGRRMRR